MSNQKVEGKDFVKQSKLYDKILKENMREVLPALVKEILGINMICREDLPESLQHTKETIPDQLSKITDETGKTYILHIEWQSEDDPCMDQRMLNYRAMLRQKYGMLVKQYVISLSRAKSRMPFIIDEENLRFSYKVISLQQYSHKIFLNAVLPEQKLMAIFGNFENERPVDVIKKILIGIEQYAGGKISSNRYKEQLRALVQLRKLGEEFKIAMGIITEFKIEKDPFYKDGVKKGLAEGRLQEALHIARELKKEGLPIDFIIRTTKLSAEKIEAL